MPAAADPSDDRPVASPPRPPTQMTRHRLAQIAEKVNPKSPENRHQTCRFLRNRLLHSHRLPAHRQLVSRSSRTTTGASFAMRRTPAIPPNLIGQNILII